MFNTGLVSVSFRNLSTDEILNRMNALGIKYIEWGGDIHAPVYDIENAENIRYKQEKLGISCSSYGSYYKIGLDDPFTLPKQIATAITLKADCMRVWCGNKNSENYDKNEKRILFSEAEKAAEIAMLNNKPICLECHNKTYTNKLDSALEIMEYINSPFFRMYWQPNQFFTFEENCEYASKISEYTTNIHVFNWEDKYRYKLSEAKDKWIEYLKYFDDDKVHNLLLEFMPDDNIDSLKEEYYTLQEIAAKFR